MPCCNCAFSEWTPILSALPTAAPLVNSGLIAAALRM